MQKALQGPTFFYIRRERTSPFQGFRIAATNCYQVLALLVTGLDPRGAVTKLRSLRQGEADRRTGVVLHDVQKCLPFRFRERLNVLNGYYDSLA